MRNRPAITRNQTNSRIETNQRPKTGRSTEHFPFRFDDITVSAKEFYCCAIFIRRTAFAGSREGFRDAGDFGEILTSLPRNAASSFRTYKFQVSRGNTQLNVIIDGHGMRHFRSLYLATDQVSIIAVGDVEVPDNARDVDRSRTDCTRTSTDE